VRSLQVQRDFEELPPGAAVTLRDTLVRVLIAFAQQAATVRTQVSLALAMLAVHLPAAQWGAGGQVGWLAERLAKEPPGTSLPCMLELLTVLPQVRWAYAHERGIMVVHADHQVCMPIPS
jgi:transportin-3